MLVIRIPLYKTIAILSLLIIILLLSKHMRFNFILLLMAWNQLVKYMEWFCSLILTKIIVLKSCIYGIPVLEVISCFLPLVTRNISIIGIIIHKDYKIIRVIYVRDGVMNFLRKEYRMNFPPKISQLFFLEKCLWKFWKHLSQNLFILGKYFSFWRLD